MPRITWCILEPNTFIRVIVQYNPLSFRSEPFISTLRYRTIICDYWLLCSAATSSAVMTPADTLSIFYEKVNRWLPSWPSSEL